MLPATVQTYVNIVCRHTCMHADIHVCMQTYTYACRHIRMHADMCVYTHAIRYVFETNKQTDRQTYRQTDTHTDRHTDRQTDIPASSTPCLVSVRTSYVAV